MKNEELLKGQSIPHDSANKHVTGLAQYTDDISEPINTLHGAIGWSKKAHAIITVSYTHLTLPTKRIV